MYICLELFIYKIELLSVAYILQRIGAPEYVGTYCWLLLFVV